MPNPRSLRFLLYFLLKTLYFHLLYLDVWSSFVKFCVWCDITEFILLLMAIQLFQHSFLKRLSFLHWITMASLLKSTNYVMCGSILGIFYSSELLCLDCYSFILSLRISSVSPITLFFFKIILAILGPLYFQVNFLISLSSFIKSLLKFWWRLPQIYGLIWKRIGILTVLSLLTHECNIFLHLFMSSISFNTVLYF